MANNLEIFLKKLVYLLAVCRSLSAQYDEFVCTQVPKNKSFFCESKSNLDSILPWNDRSDGYQTESLIINTTGNGSLAIHTADIFKKFGTLQNLDIQIHKTPHIDEKLLNSDLRSRLFDIGSLKTLSLKYDKFNDKNNSWKLPRNLENFSLLNGILEFDLRENFHPVSVQLNNNNLREIPSFHDPPLNLKTLDLRNNPMNEFSANDMAALCHLEYFAMDTSHITNCECQKLKRWIKEVQKQQDFTFDGSLNCNDTIGNFFDCTLDEAWHRRRSCLNKKNWKRGNFETVNLGRWGHRNTNRNHNSVSRTNSENTGAVLLFFFVFIMIFLCCCCCCAAFASNNYSYGVPYWQTYPVSYPSYPYSMAYPYPNPNPDPY